MYEQPRHAPLAGVAVGTAPSATHSPGHDAEDEGMGALLRRRLINFKTMPWPLRIITALGFLQLLAVGILTAFRDQLASLSLTATNATGLPLVIPQVIFFALLASFVLAWTCALTGALHSHWLVRLLGLWLFTTLVVSVQQPGVVGEIQASLLAILWLWGGALWLIERRGGPERTPLRDGRLIAATFALVLVVLASYYALLYRQDTASLADTVTGQLVVLLVLLVPVLFLAGTDLAEMGETVSNQVAHGARRVRIPGALPWVTALTAAAILVYLFLHFIPGLGSGAPTLTVAPTLLLPLAPGAAALVLLAVIAALGKVGRWSPQQGVPFPILIASLLPVLLIVIVAGVFYRSGEAFTTYRHDAQQPYFSLAYPANWKVSSVGEDASQGVTIVTLSGGQDTVLPGAFYIGRLHVPGINNNPAPSEIDAFDQTVLTSKYFSTASGPPTVQLSDAGRQDAWYVRQFTLSYAAVDTRIQGFAWLQAVDEQVYFLAGYTDGNNVTAIQQVSSRMVASWRPDLSAQIPSDGPAVSPSGGTTGQIALFGLLPLVLGVVVGLPLLLFGRRRGRTSSLAGFFFLMVGLEGAYAAAIVLLAHGTPVEADPRLALHSFQLFVALATLLALALYAVLPLGKRLAAEGRAAQMLTPLLALNVGLLVVDIATAAFGGVTSNVERLTLTQTILLVGASWWDLAMSGAQVTNVEGHMVARTGRVLLYLGYTMIISTFVLFLASLYVTSGTPVTLSDDVSQLAKAGLYFLGAPLLVTGAIFALGRMRLRRDFAPAPVEQSAGSPRWRAWVFAQRYAAITAVVFVLPVFIGWLAITLSPATIPQFQAAYAGYDQCHSAQSPGGNCVRPPLPAIGVAFLILLGVAFLGSLVLAALAGRGATAAAGRKLTGVAAAALTVGFATVVFAPANTIALAADVNPILALGRLDLATFGSASQTYAYRFGTGLGAGLVGLALLVLTIPTGALAGLLGSLLGMRA